MYRVIKANTEDPIEISLQIIFDDSNVFASTDITTYEEFINKGLF